MNALPLRALSLTRCGLLLAPLLSILSCRGLEEAAYQEYLGEKGLTEDEEEEDRDGPATVVGQILDTDGRPLERGRVLVYTGQPVERRRTEVEPVVTARLTGPDHEFRFTVSAPTTCYVFVDPGSLPPGVQPQPRRSLAQALREAGGTMRTEDTAYGFASLRAGDEARVNVVVGQPARVVGRLLNERGEPLEGALADLEASGKHGAHVERVTTDADGRFRFDAVFPGPSRLKFSSLSLRLTPLPIDIHPRQGEHLDLGTVRPPRGGGKTIHGVVTNQDGKPFAGLPIVCLHAAAPPEGAPAYNLTTRLAATTTAVDGSFVLRDLPRIPIKLSLTPNYEPNPRPGNRVAKWVTPIEIDWESAGDTIDVGTRVVFERHP